MSCICCWVIEHFYPRPPCGGRPRSRNKRRIFPAISIHALRAEGDAAEFSLFHIAKGFLSTPSVRRATLASSGTARTLLYFYPRPPCGGRHRHLALTESSHEDFYPRPPCGGRPCQYFAILLNTNKFLSTPSVWRATRRLTIISS